MITNLIEDVKDFAQAIEMDAEKKIQLQRQLTAVRSELLTQDSRVTELAARVNVYAEICEKMLSRIMDKVNHY